MRKRKFRLFPGGRDMQFMLGTLLRVGVIASMTVVFIGACVYLFRSYDALVDYRDFNPHLSEYQSLKSIYLGAVHLNGTAVIQFGLVLLIFTPVLRVAFSVFSFLHERDFLYGCIGLLVLGIILFSMSSGLAG